jgi:sugar phosphate isomerase/epimerase
MNRKVKLTILNSMAGSDFEQALDQHLEWGLHILDLKEAIFSKRVDDLLPQEAERAAQAIKSRNMSVVTLSTGIFYADIEQGEVPFRAQFSEKLARILDTAPILQPRNVRLLSAVSSKRSTFTNCADYIHDKHPWVISIYRDAIEKLHEAGFQTVIENEVHNTIFSNPHEIVDFFRALDCDDKVGFTWDIANLWEEGTFPSLDVYVQLRPLIRMVHVKGGHDNDDPCGPKRLASSLEGTSWPVRDIINAVIRDGVSPVICLNGSHGAKNPAYNHTLDDYYRDILYLRQQFDGIE